MSEDTAPQGVKAGWHLWLVGILGSLWNAFGCFDFTMTATNNQAYLANFPPEMIAYIQASPWWVWAMWFIGVFGGLAGTLLLLMRKSLAVPALAASFLAALVSMGVSMTDPEAPKMEGSEFMPFVIITVALGLLLYAWWQQKRGVLR